MTADDDIFSSRRRTIGYSEDPTALAPVYEQPSHDSQDDQPFDCISSAHSDDNNNSNSNNSAGRHRISQQALEADDEGASPPRTPSRHAAKPRGSPTGKHPWQSVDTIEKARRAADSTRTNSGNPQSSPPAPSRVRGSPKSSPPGSERRKSRPWRVDVLLKRGSGRGVQSACSSWKQQMRERKEVFALSGVTVPEQDGFDDDVDHPEPYPDFDTNSMEGDLFPRESPATARDDMSKGSLFGGLDEEEGTDCASTEAVLGALASPESISTYKQDFSAVRGPPIIDLTNLHSSETSLDYTPIHTPRSVVDNPSIIHDLTQLETQSQHIDSMAILENTVSMPTHGGRNSFHHTPTTSSHFASRHSQQGARQQNFLPSEGAPVIRDELMVARKSSVIAELKVNMGLFPQVDHSTEALGQAKELSPKSGVIATLKATRRALDEYCLVNSRNYSTTDVATTTTESEPNPMERIKAMKDLVIREFKTTVSNVIGEEDDVYGGRYTVVSYGTATEDSPVKSSRRLYGVQSVQQQIQRGYLLQELNATLALLSTRHHKIVETASGDQADSSHEPSMPKSNSGTVLKDSEEADQLDATVETTGSIHESDLQQQQTPQNSVHSPVRQSPTPKEATIQKDETVPSVSTNFEDQGDAAGVIGEAESTEVSSSPVLSELPTTSTAAPEQETLASPPYDKAEDTSVDNTVNQDCAVSDSRPESHTDIETVEDTPKESLRAIVPENNAPIGDSAEKPSDVLSTVEQVQPTHDACGATAMTQAEPSTSNSSTTPPPRCALEEESKPQAPDDVNTTTALSGNDSQAISGGSPGNETGKKGKGKASKWKERLAKKKGPKKRDSDISNASEIDRPKDTGKTSVSISEASEPHHDVKVPIVQNRNHALLPESPPKHICDVPKEEEGEEGKPNAVVHTPPVSAEEIPQPPLVVSTPKCSDGKRAASGELQVTNGIDMAPHIFDSPGAHTTNSVGSAPQSSSSSKGKRLSVKGNKWKMRLASKRGNNASDGTTSDPVEESIGYPSLQETNASVSQAVDSPLDGHSRVEGDKTCQDSVKETSIDSKSSKLSADVPLTEEESPVQELKDASIPTNASESNQSCSNIDDNTLQKTGHSDGITLVATSNEQGSTSVATQADTTSASPPKAVDMQPKMGLKTELQNSFVAFDALLRQRQGVPQPLDDDYTEYTVEDSTIQFSPPKIPQYDSEYDEETIGQSFMEVTVAETALDSTVPELRKEETKPAEKPHHGTTNLMSSRMFTAPLVHQDPTITVEQIEDDDMTQLTFDQSYAEPKSKAVDQVVATESSTKSNKEESVQIGASSLHSKGRGSLHSKGRRDSLNASHKSQTSKGTSSHGSEKTDKRVADILRKDIWSRDVAVVTQALESLAAEASRGARSRNKISQCGGVMGIIRAMESHGSSTGVQVAACIALEKMALDPDTQVIIGEMGGITAIIAGMKVDGANEDLQQAGCSALANISRHRGATDAADGAVQALCTAMSCHQNNMVVQAKAFCAISNLCMDNKDRLQELSDANGMLAMTMALQKPWPSKTEKHEAISNLSILLRCLAEQEEGNEEEEYPERMEDTSIHSEDNFDAVSVISRPVEEDMCANEGEKDSPTCGQIGEGDPILLTLPPEQEKLETTVEAPLQPEERTKENGSTSTQPTEPTTREGEKEDENCVIS